MIDYDAEAAHYDATRGGRERAAATAVAVERLLAGRTGFSGAATGAGPAEPVRVLDLACGTGIVTELLARPGRQVLGADLSAGMLARAVERLPGRMLRGDATRLPVATGSLDAVVAIWLLHLLPDAAPVLTEAARVLRPGGVLVTTVDKDSGPIRAGGDLAEVMARLRAVAPPATDAHDRVVALAGRLGLAPLAETEFAGLGQARSPRAWRGWISRRGSLWGVDARSPAGVAADQGLGALPDQERPRADPRYRLLALG